MIVYIRLLRTEPGINDKYLLNPSIPRQRIAGNSNSKDKEPQPVGFEEPEDTNQKQLSDFTKKRRNYHAITRSHRNTTGAATSREKKSLRA